MLVGLVCCYLLVATSKVGFQIKNSSYIIARPSRMLILYEHTLNADLPHSLTKIQKFFENLAGGNCFSFTKPMSASDRFNGVAYNFHLIVLVCISLIHLVL